MANKTRILTDEQVAWVRREYKRLTRKQLTAALNQKYGLDFTVGRLSSFLKNHKIRSGRTGHFPKGNVPWSAGKAGKGIIKPSAGSFKPGRVPRNRPAIGTERLSKSGYIEVKVSNTSPWATCTGGHWRFKQLLVWEAANGPVPKGHCLRFMDGNRQNCALENLVCVSRAENARLNQLSFNFVPEELRPVVLAVAKVDQAVFERRQQAEDNGHQLRLF